MLVMNEIELLIASYFVSQIPLNAQARVLFEPLFPGAQCTTLIESNKVMWTSNPTVACQREFNIEKDPRTGLMSVHVRSGQYEFQATWN